MIQEQKKTRPLRGEVEDGPPPLPKHAWVPRKEQNKYNY